MTPSRPYFIRAVYEWVLDNRMTPYVLVNVTRNRVQIPDRIAENGKVVFNISASAVINLKLDHQALEFDARFSGVTRHIYLPVYAIEAIYAFENGRGMLFNDEEHGGDDGGDTPPSGNPLIGGGSAPSPTAGKPKPVRPNLTIVK